MASPANRVVTGWNYTQTFKAMATKLLILLIKMVVRSIRILNLRRVVLGTPRLAPAKVHHGHPRSLFWLARGTFRIASNNLCFD